MVKYIKKIIFGTLFDRGIGAIFLTIVFTSNIWYKKRYFIWNFFILTFRFL